MRRPSWTDRIEALRTKGPVRPCLRDAAVFVSYSRAIFGSWPGIVVEELTTACVVEAVLHREEELGLGDGIHIPVGWRCESAAANLGLVGKHTLAAAERRPASAGLSVDDRRPIWAAGIDHESDQVS